MIRIPFYLARFEGGGWESRSVVLGIRGPKAVLEIDRSGGMAWEPVETRERIAFWIWIFGIVVLVAGNLL